MKTVMSKAESNRFLFRTFKGSAKLPGVKDSRSEKKVLLYSFFYDNCAFGHFFIFFYLKIWPSKVLQSLKVQESSAMVMVQFPICKLKWDLLRTSVTACTIDKNTFSAPFGIFYVKMEIWIEIFQKMFFTTPPNGVLSICKLPFPNGSYCNGVCRGLWA